MHKQCLLDILSGILLQNSKVNASLSFQAPSRFLVVGKQQIVQNEIFLRRLENLFRPH